MKEQIQDLIAHGRVEEALQLLVQSNNDAVLLQARYNNGKKQYNMGLIDFGEWQRVQNQVNFAILEMAASLPSAPAAPAPSAPAPSTSATQPTPKGSDTSKGLPRVFISYNHRDKEMADKIKDYLDEFAEVTIDREKMEAAQSISEFIKNSIKTNGYIVSLVSESSLKSGWVGMESTASLFAEWIADKHFIPVALDDKWSSNKFYIEALRYINDSVNEKEEEIREAKELGGRTTHIEAQKERLLDLKANLSQILDKLHNVLTLPVYGDHFDQSMESVLQVIKKG